MEWQICLGYRAGRQCHKFSQILLRKYNVCYQYLTFLQWWGDHRFPCNQLPCLPVVSSRKISLVLWSFFALVPSPFYLSSLECLQLLLLTSALHFSVSPRTPQNAELWPERLFVQLLVCVHYVILTILWYTDWIAPQLLLIIPPTSKEHFWILSLSCSSHAILLILCPPHPRGSLNTFNVICSWQACLGHCSSLSVGWGIFGWI